MLLRVESNSERRNIDYLLTDPERGEGRGGGREGGRGRREREREGGEEVDTQHKKYNKRKKNTVSFFT